LELVRAVHAAGKPVVVVLVNGRPRSINGVDRNVPAVLEAWFPGAQGGTAIADALFGDYNPGGKLTVTFPKTVGQLPFHFPSKPNAQWEGEKTRVNGALYYFGHGLSYTTFEYANLRVTPARQTTRGNVTGLHRKANARRFERATADDVLNGVITKQAEMPRTAPRCDAGTNGQAGSLHADFRQGIEIRLVRGFLLHDLLGIQTGPVCVQRVTNEVEAGDFAFLGLRAEHRRRGSGATDVEGIGCIVRVLLLLRARCLHRRWLLRLLYGIALRRSGWGF
jgi:hypothetical protein